MKSPNCAFVFLLAPILLASAQPDGPPRPNRNRPGPWDNDVLVYRMREDGSSEKLATFERAGVPTVITAGFVVTEP